MSLLLLESKRDDLLLPYYEKLRQNGLEKTFRDFKGDMLNKLSDQAGLRNLMLSSNYYLAGAVRYYFDGSLTIDGDAKYAKTGDRECVDKWNQAVCSQLNVLIEILRNAYIDTVGTSFEQPEDFGTLPIHKLLKKYGKKISAEMTSKTDSEGENSDGIDRGTRVGNGYTFEIIYSHQQAKKYERATSPGAWCITYGQGHYDRYIKDLDIHYVIFLKDGYETVERKTGPGYTRKKPHDEYGNSMIALLQSNKSWRPEYITSRWNHGAGETYPTEADHAYTLDEFCEITGVTPEDLKRIYNIWEHDKSHYSNDTYGETRAEMKKKLLDATRKIKYLQMRINGGESPRNALLSLGGTLSKILLGSEENPNKAVFVGQIDNFKFLIDKKNVVLDSISLPSASFYTGDEYFRTYIDLSNMIIIDGEKYEMIYNLRFHEMVEVNGHNKIKCIPRARIGVFEGDKFIEIKFSGKDIALLSLSTLRPLKLPNGQFIFNQVYAPKMPFWEPGNRLNAHFYGSNGPILEIIYDESSGEKYFYNMLTGKFMDFSSIVNDEVVDSYPWSRKPAISSPSNYEMILDTNFSMPGFFALRFYNGQDRRSSVTSAMLFRSNGERISIMGYDRFTFLMGKTDKILCFLPIGVEGDVFIYDTVNRKVLSFGNTPLKIDASANFYRDEKINKLTSDEIYTFNAARARYADMSRETYIYNLTKSAFAINPYDKNSMIKFKMFEGESLFDGSTEVFPEGILLTNPDFDRDKLWYKYMQNSEQNAWYKACTVAKEHAFRVKFSDLKWLPVGMPTNDESDTNSIGEREVAQMVREVLNKLKTLVK